MLTNVPSQDAAQKLAAGLVEARLAACVSVLAECTSVYRWSGAIETAVEIPLLVKTRSTLLPEVEAFIRKHHAYQVPEIVAISVSGGSAAYLAWLVQETNAEGTASAK